MTSERRIKEKRAELETRWQLLSEKLDVLHRELILETRIDEKLRLKKIVEEVETERKEVEQELNKLEQDLKKKTNGQLTPISASNKQSKNTLIEETSKTPIHIFYSYAHTDEKYRNQLEIHLSALRRQGIISEWSDRRLGAGQEWRNEIDTHLDSAEIILLLVSPDLIASDYCWDVEVKKALEKH